MLSVVRSQVLGVLCLIVLVAVPAIWAQTVSGTILGSVTACRSTVPHSEHDGLDSIDVMMPAEALPMVVLGVSELRVQLGVKVKF